jgi:hypothetical protein
MGDDATTSSCPPAAKKAKVKYIKVQNGGLEISWRTLLMAVAVVLTGGGAVGALSFASESFVEEKVQESADEIETKQRARGDRLDVTLDRHEDTTNGQVIGEVQLDVNAIQKVQHQQYARDEARRVTAKIGSRSLREETYDRLVDLNLARLKNDKPPCANLDCSH